MKLLIITVKCIQLLNKYIQLSCIANYLKFKMFQSCAYSKTSFGKFKLVFPSINDFLNIALINFWKIAILFGTLSKIEQFLPGYYFSENLGYLRR